MAILMRPVPEIREQGEGVDANVRHLFDNDLGDRREESPFVDEGI